MPYFIKIDEKDDYEYLKRYLTLWREKCRANISGYVEHIEKFERLAEAFENAKLAEAVQVIKPIEETKPKKTRRKRGEAAAERPNLCPDHPTYGAKHRPTRECETCWQAYGKYNGPAKLAQAKRKFAQSRGTT